MISAYFGQGRSPLLSKAEIVMTEKYSVLLLYPDYLSDDNETFLAHVEGETIDEAVNQARAEALASNPGDDVDPVDFKLIFAAAGHIDDLSGNAQEGR